MGQKTEEEQGRPRVVLDTNIIISALGWGGKPKKCFELILKGDLISITSPEIIHEVEKVMEYPKFSFKNKEKREFLEVITKSSIIIEPKTEINLIKEDPTDNMFLEAAITGHADYIISGDKDLLNLERFKEIRIIKPEKCLKII